MSTQPAGEIHIPDVELGLDPHPVELCEPARCKPGEQHTGNPEHTGEGQDAEPIRSVIDHLTEAAKYVNWKPDEKHSAQARYDALRALTSIYAYATLVTLETLQRTNPAAADRVAEHLSHDDWHDKSENAHLWHESLTGGPRHARFDEELHLIAGNEAERDAAIRQQIAEEIAVAIEAKASDTSYSEPEEVTEHLLAAAQIAREIGAKA